MIEKMRQAGALEDFLLRSRMRLTILAFLTSNWNTRTFLKNKANQDRRIQAFSAVSECRVDESIVMRTNSIQNEKPFDK